MTKKTKDEAPAPTPAPAPFSKASSRSVSEAAKDTIEVFQAHAGCPLSRRIPFSSVEVAKVAAPQLATIVSRAVEPNFYCVHEVDGSDVIVSIRSAR